MVGGAAVLRWFPLVLSDCCIYEKEYKQLVDRYIWGCNLKQSALLSIQTEEYHSGNVNKDYSNLQLPVLVNRDSLAIVPPKHKQEIQNSPPSPPKNNKQMHERN